MDPIERVNSHFARSIEVSRAAGELLAAPIANAARRIVDSLLNGGKLVCCGNAGSAADAQYFATLMQHRFERERPGLPAIAVSNDSAILTAIATDQGFDAVFAKQISALGHPGDVLLTLSADGSEENIVAAVDAARERQMQIIAVNGASGGEVAGRLRDGDIEIRTPASEAARVLENHRLVIHCLCDLIDLQLMGG